MKISVSQKVPRLVVPITVWLKLMAFVQKCPVEMNGFGVLDCTGDNTYVLSDVCITEQTAGPGHVDVTPEAMGQLMTDMIRAGDDPSRIKFQWHSHVNMEAYFSATDETNIERWPGKWLISLVVNKRGDYACRLDLLEGDIRVTLDITPELYATPDPEILRDVADEVRGKVTKVGVLRRRPVTDGQPSEASPLTIGPPESVILGGED